MKKIFVTLLMLIIGCLSYSSQKVGLEIGNVLKPFEIYSYPDGKVFRNEDFKGKITILNFGTTWCPVCLEEKKDQERFVKENQELMKEVNLVPVLMDSKEDIKKYVDKHGFSLKIYEDRNSKIGNAFLIRAVPITFILNENGVIIYKEIGAIDYESLKEALERKELE